MQQGPGKTGIDATAVRFLDAGPRVGQGKAFRSDERFRDPAVPS